MVENLGNDLFRECVIIGVSQSVHHVFLNEFQTFPDIIVLFKIDYSDQSLTKDFTNDQLFPYFFPLTRDIVREGIQEICMYAS